MKLLINIFLFIFLMDFASAQPTVPKEKFHLFLLVGQSNMAGRGKVETTDQVTHPRIWMLTKDNEWRPAIEPLHFDKPGIVGVGPGLSFAKSLIEEDTALVIGLIPSAVGGSAIQFWQPGKYYDPTKSYPYDDAVRRVKIATKHGVLKGILWHQGESDSDSIRAKTYAASLSSLVKRFRKDCDSKHVPFIAATLAEFWVTKHPYALAINKAIQNLPSSTKRTSVVSSLLLTHAGDHTHFDTPSARELGQRYAKAFQSLTVKP